MLVSAINHIVEFSFEPMQAIFSLAYQRTSLCKLIPLSVGGMTCRNRMHTCVGIIVFEAIGFSINNLPTLLIIPGAIEVLKSLIRLMPVALYQKASGQFISHRNTIHSGCVRTIVASTGLPIEQIVVFADAVPTLLGLADNCVVGIAVFLKQATILGLTDIDAVLTEVIVEVFNLLNTGQSFAFHIVGEATLFIDPAFLQDVYQGVFICDLSVDIAEIAARVGGVGRITVGIQAKHCLIFRLLCKAVQAAGTHVNLIADGTGGHSINLGNILPCTSLGCQLDTVDETQGICGGLVNHLALLDPIQGHSQGVGGLIKLRTRQFEVVIEDLHITVIHSKTVIKVHGCLNPSQITDTLCQAQQEAPGIGTFHGTTGQHVSQLFQPFGDGNGSHIQSEGVGCDHILGGIDNIVDIAIFYLGIGNLAVPGQHAIAASSLIKVEAVLTLLIKHDVDGCTDTFSNRGCDGQGLDRRLCSLEGEAIHSTCSRSAQGDGHVIRVDGNRLATDACTQRQYHAGTVDRIHLCSFKIELVRVGQSHQLAADGIAIQHQIYIDFTQTLTGEDTVFSNLSPSLIADCPDSTLGDIHSVAAGADTGSSHLHGSVNRSVVILALDHSMVKRCRTGSSRIQQQTGRNVTGISVGRPVHNGQFFTAGLTCHESGRTAAVQIDCFNTTGFLHDIANILQACTGREGVLTTINTHDDYTTS